MNLPKFTRAGKNSFDRTLRKAVNNYFEENNLKKTGGYRLYLKASILIFALVVMTFSLFKFQFSWLPHLVISMAIGVIFAGIGMGVMHDGNHGSFSKYTWINQFFGATIYILAGNSANWKAQHNHLHHTFTNIHPHDEDLDAGRFIRFSKFAKWRKFHKYQKYYAPFLYSLMTFNWVLTTDFFQTARFLKDERMTKDYPKPTRAWTVVIVSKIILFSFWIVLPIFLGIFWVKVLIGFYLMHSVAGFILSNIFQLAHVNSETDVSIDVEYIPESFMEHQLKTTANFGTKNRLLIWYAGGLTHQVEHHLFPNISHVHYPKIAEIVKEKAKEFNLAYIETVSAMKAWKEHYAHIAKLGKKPQII